MKKAKHPRVILVTGCSSGLGLALAQALVLSGDRVIVTARAQSLSFAQSRIAETESVWLRTLDVTDEDAVDSLINEITTRFGGVDVLINNAGICYRSVVEQMDEESELDQIRTNYLGPMSIIRAVIPTMRERGCGHIVNISSVSGSVAMPTMGSYSASKAALESATESLWYEMRPFGISVSLVLPGFIHSQSFRNTRFSRKSRLSRESDGPYSDFYRDLMPFIERLMNSSRSTPDAIAAKIMRLINNPRPALFVPVTRDAIFFGFLRRVLPHGMFHRLMYNRLPGSKTWGHANRNALQGGGIESYLIELNRGDPPETSTVISSAGSDRAMEDTP